MEIFQLAGILTIDTVLFADDQSLLTISDNDLQYSIHSLDNTVE
jgi:hypothetical protein